MDACLRMTRSADVLAQYRNRQPQTNNHVAAVKTIITTLVLLSPLLCSIDALATVCDAQQVYWTSVDARGEVRVGGTFGVAKSTDGGRHWSELPTRRTNAGAAGGPSAAIQADTVTNGENGRQYACSADRERVAWRDARDKDWTLSEPLDRRSESKVIELLGNGRSRARLESRDLNGKLVKTRKAGPLFLADARRDSCDSIVARQDSVHVLGHDAIFTSKDGGRSWFGAPAPEAVREERYVTRRLFVDDAGTLYVNGATPTAVRIFASTDAGLHWNVWPLKGLGNSQRHDEILYATAGADLYVLKGYPGSSMPQLAQAYRARNDGTSATAIVTLPSQPNGLRLVSLDAAPGGHVAAAAAGAYDSRVFVSKDKGQTWVSTDGARLTSQPSTECNGPPPRD